MLLCVFEQLSCSLSHLLTRGFSQIALPAPLGRAEECKVVSGAGNEGRWNSAFVPRQQLGLVVQHKGQSPQAGQELPLDHKGRR